MSTIKKARSIDGRACKDVLKQINDADPKQLAYAKGIGGDPLEEPLPNYLETSSEEVISGKNNTFIVLGRDRPGGRMSGYGGRGDTQAGSIDIVVGRMGPKVSQCNKNGKKIWVDPMMDMDAARIYISQKTDVDYNFKLAPGSLGSPGLAPPRGLSGPSNPRPTSAIAIKADNLRFISREGVKIVTEGQNVLTSQSTSPKRQVYGVDIIAGNSDVGKDFELQPMVKGKNLSKALDEMSEKVRQLNAIVLRLLKYQHSFNKQLANHEHFSPFQVTGNEKTTVSFPVQSMGVWTMESHNSVMEDLKSLYDSIDTYKETYLKNSGDLYINSRHNNVN